MKRPFLFPTTPALMKSLLKHGLSLFFAANVCLGADFVENVTFQTTVVFVQKPFDYEVDLILDASAVLPQELSDFNTSFSLLPEYFLKTFTKDYFEMFQALYPGLKGVSIHGTDLEGLIAFGILHSTDQSTFKGHLFVLSESFHTSMLYKNLLNIDLIENAFQHLFDCALHGPNFYTIEAFFQTGLAAFNDIFYYSSLELSNFSGDFRLVNRIASMLDVETRKTVFTSRFEKPAWPQENCVAFTPPYFVNIPYEVSKKEAFSVDFKLGEVK